jgi:SAM-dependent methyltransferase
MIWCCPVCRGTLAWEVEAVRCLACERRYESVAGVPDLRLPGSAWIDFSEDLRRARELIEAVAPEDIEGALDYAFRRREGWDETLVDRRVRQVVELPDRRRAELDEWLAPLRDGTGPLLDLGCGQGSLLAAAAAMTAGADSTLLGVDVSMEWLVVAQRTIRSVGGEAMLACALAEALPLPDASVARIAVLDVIEHVGDPAAVIREVNRVVRPGGVVALATPNRFSLTAEPHVGIWGVGWLPVRLQDGYVRRRSGKPYGFVRLLSRRELSRLFRRNSEITARIGPGTVPGHELRYFSPRRARAARLYNRLVSRRLPARIISPISPFFYLVGRRR